MGKKHAALLALPSALALALAPVGVATAADQSFQVDLKPLNDSGAKGTVLMTLRGTQLSLRIEARGLVPNAPHVQHIHGSTEGKDFVCPTDAADANGDGVVTTAEGVSDYGDVLIALTTEGSTDKSSGLALDRMPKADRKGNVNYQRTIILTKAQAAKIKDLHIVEHGIDTNGNNVYDNSAGQSELDPKLFQEATAPATCGMIAGSSMGSVPAGPVETGGQGTQGPESPAVLGLGAAALAAAGAVAVAGVRRRRAQIER